MNCIIVDDDEFIRKIIEEYIRKTSALHLLHSLSSAVAAIDVLNSTEKVDLIFLDIEMPEMSGLDFLKAMTVFPQVIIISKLDKYAIDAFDFDVTDYLVKPLNYSRFSKAVSRAVNRHKSMLHAAVVNEQNIVENDIFVRQSNVLVKIKFSDILWIEAMENYIVINTFNDKFTVHFTMRAIEQRLPAKMFIRVHRSFIVNVSEIQTIEENVISIVTKCSTPNKIPIGKVYKNNLLKTLNLMVRE